MSMLMVMLATSLGAPTPIGGLAVGDPAPPVYRTDENGLNYVPAVLGEHRGLLYFHTCGPEIGRLNFLLPYAWHQDAVAAVPGTTKVRNARDAALETYYELSAQHRANGWSQQAVELNSGEEYMLILSELRRGDEDERRIGVRCSGGVGRPNRNPNPAVCTVIVQAGPDDCGDGLGLPGEDATCLDAFDRSSVCWSTDNAELREVRMRIREHRTVAGKWVIEEMTNNGDWQVVLTPGGGVRGFNSGQEAMDWYADRRFVSSTALPSDRDEWVYVVKVHPSKMGSLNSVPLGL